MINKREIGRKGELVAEKYLIDRKYEIICKNFQTRRGEIDIIAKKGKYIIFVEVKTRNNNLYGTPAMAVNKEKIKHMKLVSKVFIIKNRLENFPIRFDVIEVFVNNDTYRINHIKQII